MPLRKKRVLPCVRLGGGGGGFFFPLGVWINSRRVVLGSPPPITGRAWGFTDSPKNSPLITVSLFTKTIQAVGLAPPGVLFVYCRPVVRPQ